MSKGRRTPPLFDVLSGVEGRARPGGPGGGVLGNGARGGAVGGMGNGLPIQVQIPASAPRSGAGVDVGETRPMTGERSAVSKKFKVTAPAMWMGVACVLALLAAAWFFAFQMGKTNAEKEFAARIDGGSGAGTAAPGAASSNGGGNSAPNANGSGNAGVGGGGVPSPLIPEPKVNHTEHGPNGAAESFVFTADEDPRQAGVNYLHIVVLPWNDAEAAAAFLVKNGVRAGAVPQKQVDGRGGQANNLPLLVFALDGVPSDRYKATAKERADLVDKVRAIGKRFQREERGASDFAGPLWTKYESR